MNPAAGLLDFGATSSLHVPLRFMLTAPLFGIAAGVMLMLAPETLASRWLPGTFAMTHLIAVGFMLSVMVGALFQILPVVAGASVPGGAALAALVHLALTAGAVLLGFGLAMMSPGALQTASLLLGSALAVFLIAVAVALRASKVMLDSQRDLRIALGGLGVAVLLGVTLALVLANGWVLPFAMLLDLHVGWALLGGMGLVLAAASWIVVPMFQITPAYPRWMTRAWALTVFVVLGLWSAALVPGQARLAEALLALALALAALFAVATLLLQQRSRRSVSDATTRAFRVAMLAFLAGLACAAAARVLPDERWAVAAGALLLYGGFTGAIQGMLYKIVPFLCWLDLSQSGRRAPNMKKLQPDRPVALQARVHLAALLATLLAVGIGEALPARVAGALVAADFAWLLWNMAGVLRAHAAARGQELLRRD